LSAFFIYS